MKKALICALAILLHFYASAQSTKYFDAHNSQITKQAFEKLKENSKYLVVVGDSAHHKKIIHREETGKTANYQRLKTLLEQQIGKELSKNTPTVVIFHPGKDECNTSGAPSKTRNAWHKELAKGVRRLTKGNPIYLCKDKKDIDESSVALPWLNDPEHIFEETFFKHHYPCGSFVIISPNGRYISYFGEFTKEQVWNAIKQAKTQHKISL